MSSATKEQFSVGKILSSLLALLAFAVLTGIGIKTIAKNPRWGWFAIVLFGTMSVVAVIEIFRNCGLDQDQVPDVKAQLNIRRWLVHIGTVIVTIFMGVADHFISLPFSESFPRPGVWLGSFLTNLAFYPFREEKEDLPNFSIWTIYCALLGVASVVLSYLKDWLEGLLS